MNILSSENTDLLNIQLCVEVKGEIWKSRNSTISGGKSPLS